METNQPTKVTVQAVIQAPVEKVWRYWTEPDHITKWNQASEDWHAPRAENDLRVGGKFLTRMEAKDGSMGFDFGGVYDVVNRHEAIGYTMEDGRRRRSLKRSTRKAPIPSSSSKQAGKRSWTISKPLPNKTNHREEDAGEDARRLSF